MGYSSILLDDHGATLTSDQRQALDRIQANSHELLSCVEGIFFLAALEAGEIPLTVWSFDAKTILARLAERHAEAFAEKNVRLEVGDLPRLPIRTDEEKLAKIVDILVLNGLKFTETGSVRVEAAVSPDGPLEIRVRDTGIGMRAEEVEEVLEGFRQADPTARKRFRGIGLGLRLVTRMVGAIGGKLDVQSSLGGGTEFVVIVPPIAESSMPAPEPRPLAAGEMKEQLSA
jgi:signal transduction histidine kinase